MDTGNGVPVPVHGIGGAREVAGENVAEQLAADRAAARRGSEHRDRARPEEGLERRANRDVVACGRLLAIGGRRLDRKPDLGLAALTRARDREPGVPEDPEHRRVLLQHVGHERLDPGLRRPGCELFEQARADPAPLELVADGEGDLGRRRVAQPDPIREGDYPAVE